MGKAIVINGLKVNNPLCVVNLFEHEEEVVLASYFAKNQSINDVEKSALTSFVKGLIDVNIWQKIHYFYPLLGDNLSDMRLEVVNPNDDDLFARQTDTGLSVSDRKLCAIDRLVAIGYNGYVKYGSRGNAIDFNNVSFISSFNAGTELSSGYAGIMFANTSGGTNKIGMMDVYNGGYKQPALCVGRNGSTDEYIPKNYQSSETHRDTFSSIKNGEASIYLGNVLVGSGSAYTSVRPDGCAMFCTNINKEEKHKASWNMIAISESLTSEEWELFYQMMTQFLTEVGKR